ncbi:DNA-processing protein DprA [Anaerococcus sp. Marseille-Q7828]|uniref:DNA-processing protein DprA n=1 Tax=Anaerococcus sp. Marseille-Q7828 TaxID=3036300 RepID=UPI0024AD78D3|nr:DNA-processing protein DprA [Anaerococcus sp. Marseille-Q7828]
MHSEYTDREIILYLNYIYLDNRVIHIIYERVGFKDLFERSRIDLDFIPDISYEKIVSNKNLESFKSYNEKVQRYGYTYVTFLDDDYPFNLRYIDDRPTLLFYKGRLDREKDKNSIAFVGARKCTEYGKWACKNLSQDISRAGITTVSGLAYGIDAMCHKSTLEVAGRSIGVIGCGIDKIYPKQNRKLYQALEEDGLILSEFPLETEPRSYNFPRRNRIISGISLATVVIEAKEKSGTMITTRCALDQGKEVFAVPGNINSIYSRGTNKLIQEGSKLITCADDILEELDYLLEYSNSKNEIDYSSLEKDELDIVKYIEENPNSSADILSAELKIKIDEINYLLTSLELRDFIENIGNNEFTVKR